MIYHHDLQKRITKLEKACKVPKREQHDFSLFRLSSPVDVYVEGVRINRSHEDSSSSNGGVNGSRKPSTHMPSKSSNGQTTESSSKSLRGTKTIWEDPREGNGECSVEAMCLSHYRAEGWKGFHCEGRLIRTLFAYLFWDILFMYVPNVFQTPFQTCPFDLHTDAFFPTRLSEINRRLAEICNGHAATIIQARWDEHHDKRTCVVGLDWDYDIADVLEIVGVFDGRGLAAICQVLAEEYATRGGGIPDLFLWHPERKLVKFAEVKSENDRLSDTQRAWIDVITGAGVRVELCHAVEKKTAVSSVDAGR